MATLRLLRSGLLVVAVLMLVMGAGAQSARELALGVQRLGEITEEEPAQVYTLIASAAGDLVNIGITSQPGLSLVFVVTDAEGNQLGMAADTTGSGGVSLLNIPLGEGTNYVTVFPAAGSLDSTGQYRLLAEASTGEAPAETPDATPSSDEATPEPVIIPTETPGDASDVTGTPEGEDPTEGFQLGQVLTTAGLEVVLTWNSTADLNLELRDPDGQRLFFDSRTNENGGTFGFDVNGLCEVLNADAQETATYPPGGIPAGSYEVLVYYRQNCENNGPQNFTVNITVDGQALDDITGTLQPPTGDDSTVFIGSFMVNLDGSAVLGASGVYQDTRVLPQTLVAALPTAPRAPLTDGVPARGIINGPSYFDLYSFEGTANQVVSIGMTRLSGNLDTLLLVLDPAGQIIADNDDIVAGNVTDSAINNPPLRLPVDGQYIVLATRYGKDVGGTAGEYEVLLQTQTTVLPEDVVALGLPVGDIQVTLVWNTNADLQLLVRDPSGESVFDDEPTIRSGGRIFAQGNVNCTVALTTPVSHIYWPTGLMRGGIYEVDVWYQNQCGDTRAVNATLYITVAGQQLAALPITPDVDNHFVTSFVIDATGRATLGEGGIVRGSETFNFSSEIEGAQQILPGTPARGSIDANNDFDVFAFAGEAGQAVSIRMERTQGTLDTNLFLISPSLFQVESNDDAVAGTTTDSLIEFTLPETGQYLILATRFGTIFGGTTGTYQLTLTFETE